MPPNARHHPRPYSTYMRGMLMGRRVHAVVRCGVSLKVIFGKAGHLHQVAEQPCLQRLIPVDWDGQPDITPGSAVDMMAALDAQQRPAVTFKDFGELLAGDRPHTAISSTRSPPATCAGDTSTERHPSTAS